MWKWNGAGAWYFCTLPKTYTVQIKSASKVRRGWGSVRVRVTIGSTAWDTSIFPDSKSGTYLLPIKKTVRLKEELEEGDSMRITVKLV